MVATSTQASSPSSSPSSQTRKLILTGAAGPIEAVVDTPAQPPIGTALVCHPHPLFGGTMDNKVVHTLARAFVLCGWQALRFNFRGVGASAGVHDAGQAETQDALDVIQQLAPQGPLALAGFSFGAFVASQTLAALMPQREPAQVVLVGTAASRFTVAPIASHLHLRTLVVHGEEDDTVPLTAVMDWARPQSLPVSVVPGAGHFFHGQLPLLRELVMRHLRACPDTATASA